MAYGIASDVGTELGRPAASTAEEDQWTAWLDRVERAIAREFVRRGSSIDDALTAGTITERDLIDVEVAAAVRKAQNPTWGQTSSTRSVDDTQVTVRAEGASASGDPLNILDSEWASLFPSSKRVRSAFSVLPS